MKCELHGHHTIVWSLACGRHTVQVTGSQGGACRDPAQGLQEPWSSSIS
jgi:hypothetical protein